MESTFNYEHRGCHVDYKGMGFDSLLELRYAISIRDEYAYERECVKIFYNPQTNNSTNYLKENTKSYKPDFLIRNHKTGQAYLIEVKPDGFDDYDALTRFQQICHHYIIANHYDWEYKIVFENDIALSQQQQELYDAIISNKILYRQHYKCYSLDHRKFHGCQSKSKELQLYLKRNKLPQHFN